MVHLSSISVSLFDNTLIEQQYTYRIMIHLSNNDTLIEQQYTYRIMIHLSNNNTLIE